MLYEHQSAWNPNMPLRDLFYSSAAPEYTTLRLSDAYMERKDGSQEKKEPELMKKCRTLREYREFWQIS